MSTGFLAGNVLTMVVSSVLLFFACSVTLIIGIYYTRTRYGNRSGSTGGGRGAKGPPPLTANGLALELNQVPTAEAINRCLRHFVKNPNYYSGSPDGSATEGPLVKLLKALELPPDRISFAQEIGEGCFGKVYKGKFDSHT